MRSSRWIAPLLFVCTLALYVRTLAPTVVELFDDSLEFQLVGYQLAIAHPTGYPLYTLLLKLFTLLPLGDAAYRANLLSALCAALAVTLVYQIVLRLTSSIVPSLVAAVALAVSPVFWSQAVVAEVYALNALFVAGIVWVIEIRDWRLEIGDWRLRIGRWEALALLFGLALTHHRTIILLAPALIIYVWQVAGGTWQVLRSQIATPSVAGRTVRKSLLAFLAPLTLYLYLPLRGDVGSLDGTYENTLAGFVRWVTASNYNIFLSGNPFNAHYDAAFFVNLFAMQFGWLGLALGAMGLLALLAGSKRKTESGMELLPSAFRLPPAGLFLIIAFVTYVIFVLNYRVPDVQVFAIPAFLIIAIALGCGVHELARWSARARTRTWRVTLFALLGIALAANFTPIAWLSFPQNDRSGQTEVRDYGRDMLAQPLPADATLVGILGETTLVRYLQATKGLQPSLTTIAADRDAERLASIARAIQEGRAVFTTRPLDGLAEKFSLSALGPLVRVWPAPQPSDLPADAPRVDTMKYRVDGVVQPQPRVVRAQIAWEPTVPLTSDLKISARLLNGDRLIAQHDDWPVHNAYHTNFWRDGEIVHDVYDVRVPNGTPAQIYRVLLIVYRADSGAEVGRVEAGEIEAR